MRLATADGSRAPGDHAVMDPLFTLLGKWPLAGLYAQLRDRYPLLLLSAAAIVLSSMDQCTRGPSITGMILANLDWWF
jgi:hypothetical protein